jgi:hypothetical protein
MKSNCSGNLEAKILVSEVIPPCRINVDLLALHLTTITDPDKIVSNSKMMEE